MAEQMHLRGGGAYTPYQPFKSNVFRLDEGYSEETRSQAGSEMPTEPRLSDLMEADGPQPFLLPADWTSNLEVLHHISK